MELLRNFKELDKGDVGLAGGKGASLGEMTQAGIPVPPGFVILSVSFEKFIEETGLIAEIAAILGSVNHEEIHTIENASEKIQALILAAEMPKDIKREVVASFKKLGAKYVAVRSSATAEDSSSDAWAGQLDSFLNTTEKDLLEKVKRCWASLFTPRAIFYRFEKKLDAQKISVAVVVQKMVESEISGIAFSVHPVTQDHNQLIIEASYGLGEAIVSGQVTPDSYVVEKQPRRIIERMVQSKTRGIYRSATGNDWNNIPNPKADQQAISDTQILKLSELILHIEQHYGFPCDIEWAFEKGKFYIVQSRPITTLMPKIDEVSFAEKLDEVELSFKEYLPLLWVYPFTSVEFATHYRRYTNTDVSVLYKIVNGELSDYQSVDAPSRVYQAAKGKFQDPAYWKNLFKIYTKNVDSLRSLSDQVASPKKIARMSNAELIKMLKLVKNVTEEVYPMTNMCYFFSLELENNTTDDLSSLQPFRETYSLHFRKEAYRIRKTFPDKELGEKTVKRAYANNAKIRKEIDAFAEEFKYLTSVSLGTRKPESFFADICSASTVHIPGSASLTPDQKIMAECLFYKDEISTFLIPFVKHGLMPIWNEAAKRLKIHLSDLEALHIEEIIQFLDEPKELKERLKQRKEFIWGVHVGLSDETYLFQGSESQDEFERLLKKFLVKPVNHAANIHEFRGKIGNKGLAKGRVHIVQSSSDVAAFEVGSVLVAVYTAPELVPVMKKASAIITDTGGVACHAAIVSRELGIPCVVGAKIATQVLKDGDMVEVDANTGMVKILSAISAGPSVTAVQLSIPKIADFDFNFESSGTTFLFEDFVAEWYVPQGSVTVWRNGLKSVYLSKQRVRAMNKEALALSPAALNVRVRKLDRTIAAALKELGGFAKKKDFTKRDAIHMSGVLGDIMKQYFNFDFAFWDDTFKRSQKDSGAKRKVEVVQAYKNKVRADMEPIFFTPAGYMGILESSVSKKLGIPKSKLIYYRTQELADAFNGAIISDTELDMRREGYVYDKTPASGMRFYSGPMANEFTERFLGARKITTSTDKVIKGKTAHATGGVVRGRVRIIARDYGNSAVLKKQMAEMKKGEILVSQTTDPELMPAIKKAAAIVTDIGGLLSHSAIVARELDIPCVIETLNASKMLRTGDMVEVDAEKGVVKIIKRK